MQVSIRLFMLPLAFFLATVCVFIFYAKASPGAPVAANAGFFGFFVLRH